MIDEQYLDHWINQHKSSHESIRLMLSNYDDVGRLLELARLGLWAEQHGVPALKAIAIETPETIHTTEVEIAATTAARAVLSALPSQTEGG